MLFNLWLHGGLWKGYQRMSGENWGMFTHVLAVSPDRLLPSFNVWYHFSDPNPLGVLPSIAGCCDTSGSINARKKRKYPSTKVSGLLIHCERFQKPWFTLSASAFPTSTWKRWRSRFHLLNHLVQVLNPPPFIISWQRDGGKM